MGIQKHREFLHSLILNTQDRAIAKIMVLWRGVGRVTPHFGNVPTSWGLLIVKQMFSWT
jgi:hypothetical protein